MERRSAERVLRASEERLAAQSSALTTLTARYAEADDRFDDRLRDILALSAETLQVERLSMWRFDDDRAAIECVAMFRRSRGGCECGGRLWRHQAPAYFAALETERVIAAADAPGDPRTCEFRDGYLRPNGIGAMLDVPLRQHRATTGVLCAEHVGGRRDWTVDEQNFAVSVGNLIVVAAIDEERRSALTRLAESEARARLVVDTAHDAFIGIDADSRIVNWNAQAERTFGWTRDEAIGRNLTETIIPPAYREAHSEGMRRFLETGEAPVVNRRLELVALNRAGREFPIELTITSPVIAGGGYFFGAFLRDISDRRERDDELRRARDSAEAATRAKSEFLANMSHELRTPLNGVLGYAQLLQRDPTVTPPQREALDAIARCGAQLLELINDVLDLARIEAGRLDVEPSSTDLAQLIVDLKYVVGVTARRKGLELSMRMAPDIPRYVRLDGRYLRQVLLNLLGNAIKFTSDGHVRLAISRSGDDRLSFEVVDTGIGIEPEALAKVFEAFTQTRAGALAGGTGLGLAISHHLVKRMGGELQVESTPGEGSRFHFALPLVAASKPEQGDEAIVDASAPLLHARLAPGQVLTALIVDDSTVNRRILATLLESAGIGVITAAGGLEGLEIARTQRPDVIFMDVKMADVDGIDATRRLKSEAATADIPVIAVTASAFGETRQAAFEAGCVDYLPKPVRAGMIFGALQSHLKVRFLTGAEPSPPATATADAAGLDAARRQVIADRIRTAIAIGDVTDLQRLGQELGGALTAEKDLGTRIVRLAGSFDFEALGALADALSPAVADHVVE
jgi:PAS domain S-box-containing protein